MGELHRLIGGFPISLGNRSSAWATTTTWAGVRGTVSLVLEEFLPPSLVGVSLNLSFILWIC